MKRIPCAFSVSPDLLAKIDARAAALGLNRSAYIVQVVRSDLLGGDAALSIVAERRATYGTARARAGRRRRAKGREK
ncbi:MAG: hypothetical protein JXR37_22910 [Kiritimatiellae bacterium]|nr:hypothetical protein [Kiritimatiellia bacterium]